MTTIQPPQFPAGEYVTVQYDNGLKPKLLERLESVPLRARKSVDGLSEPQLDSKYRNWTIRQIIHHLADSHINCYVRFKWALTEQTPNIKTYDESRWSEVIDALSAPLESSLRILEGVHARWGQLVRRLSDEQLQRDFYHPEMDRVVTLAEALPSYVWHADHHLAQIAWLRDKNNW